MDSGYITGNPADSSNNSTLVTSGGYSFTFNSVSSSVLTAQGSYNVVFYIDNSGSAPIFFYTLQNPTTSISTAGDWYIQGRFGYDGNSYGVSDWSANTGNNVNEALKFTSEGNGVYSFDTKQTLKSLGTNITSADWSTNALIFRKKYSSNSSLSDRYIYTGGWEYNTQNQISTKLQDTYNLMSALTSDDSQNGFKTNFASSTDEDHYVKLWIKEDGNEVYLKYTLEDIPAASTTYTLYFDALDSGWTPSANVYDTGNGNADVLATTAMTKYSGTSANIYSVTFSTGVDLNDLEVKFSNNGATPTSGYRVEDGKVYRYDGTNVTDSITNYIASNYAENIYFDKPVQTYWQRDANNSYVYRWHNQANTYAYLLTGDSGDGKAWPGHPMTQESTGLYKYDTVGTDRTFLSYSTTSGTARNTEWSTFISLYNSCKNYPAVITYEKAIVQSDQPALRNDGRWYYSKESERIANVELYNIVGNIEVEYKAKGTTGFVKDEFGDPVNGVYTAPVTHAEPRFTDDDKYVDKTNSTQIKEITKIINGTSYNFTAPEYTEEVEGEQVTRRFVFVGWYLKNDKVYTEINPTDVTNPDGSTPRLSSETFVARYEEVIGRTLVVNHNTGSSTGTGKTYSVVKIYDKDGTNIFDERKEGPITVDSTYLDDENTITISIEAIADSTSRYESTKDMMVESNAQDITTTMTKADNNTSASKTIQPTTGSDPVKVSTLFPESSTYKKYSYTSNFSLATFKVVYCFYDRDTTTKKIDIKTTPTAVEVNVPYAADDTIAKIISNGMNQDVSTGTGTVSTLSNILDKYYIWTTQTAAEAGIGGLDDVSSTKTNGKYSTYSTTQSGNLAKHFDSLGKPITTEFEDDYDYGTLTRDDKTALQSRITTQNWVNYKLKNGSSYATTTTNEGTTYTTDNTEEVVVWAFNTPKTYSVKFIYPVAADNDGNAGTSQSQPYNTVNTQHIVKNSALINNNGNGGAAINVYSYDYTIDDMNDGKLASNNDTINTNNASGRDVFYGQRFGTLFTKSVTVTNTDKEHEGTRTYQIKTDAEGNLIQHDEENNKDINIPDYDLDLVRAALDERDQPGTHISQYGVTLGFLDEKIVVIKEFNMDVDGNGTEEKLVFDGWYDDTTGAKVTSDYDYGYRVTSDLTLRAGYIVSTDVSETKTPKATVLADDFDYYFVSSENGQEISEKMRFNTTLNVYDSKDNNTDIKQVAAAYIQLYVEGEGTNYTTQKAYTLAQDTAFIAALKSEIKSTLDKEANHTNYQWFEYNGDWVAWKIVYTYVTNGNDTGTKLSLNSKNRAIFTMTIDADKYDENNEISAMLVFGAIKVNNTWTISDNCVQYINCDPPVTSTTPQTANDDNGDDGEGEEPVEPTTP